MTHAICLCQAASLSLAVMVGCDGQLSHSQLSHSNTRGFCLSGPNVLRADRTKTSFRRGQKMFLFVQSMTAREMSRKKGGRTMRDERGSWALLARGAYIKQRTKQKDWRPLPLSSNPFAREMSCT